MATGSRFCRVMPCVVDNVFDDSVEESAPTPNSTTEFDGSSVVQPIDTDVSLRCTTTGWVTITGGVASGRCRTIRCVRFPVKDNPESEAGEKPLPLPGCTWRLALPRRSRNAYDPSAADDVAPLDDQDACKSLSKN